MSNISIPTVWSFARACGAVNSLRLGVGQLRGMRCYIFQSSSMGLESFSLGQSPRRTHHRRRNVSYDDLAA